MKWLLGLLVVLSGCAAPKDSYKSFPRPKYDVNTKHRRNGVPGVRQTWWIKAWFWQPLTKKQRKAHTIKMR